MTHDEAAKIVELYYKWNDISCTCLIGNPPCPKCTECPSKEDYNEAILYDFYKGDK